MYVGDRMIAPLGENYPAISANLLVKKHYTTLKLLNFVDHTTLKQLIKAPHTLKRFNFVDHTTLKRLKSTTPR